jgi:hypothetical protein
MGACAGRSDASQTVGPTAKRHCVQPARDSRASERRPSDEPSSMPTCAPHHGMCRREMLRAITNRWISDVPSKIV